MDFTIQQWYLFGFLEKKKVKIKISKFMFLPLSGLLKILERKKETVKKSDIL